MTLYIYLYLYWSERLSRREGPPPERRAPPRPTPCPKFRRNHRSRPRGGDDLETRTEVKRGRRKGILERLQYHEIFFLFLEMCEVFVIIYFFVQSHFTSLYLKICPALLHLLTRRFILGIISADGIAVA